jgi:hypothetical protein
MSYNNLKSKHIGKKIVFVTVLSLALFVNAIPITARAAGTFTCQWNTMSGLGGGCVVSINSCTGDSVPDATVCSERSQTNCVSDGEATCRDPETDIFGTTDPGAATGGSVHLDNPLNVESVPNLIGLIVDFLKMAAGSILVVIILFGAFQIMTSSGNPENLKKGRNTIVWALIGFGIILLASGLGAIIANILGGTVETLPGTKDTATTTDVIGIIDTIAGWMFGILMALGTVFVLYSAFLFLISGGDAQKVSTAKRALIYAVVALIIGVLAGGAKFLVTNALDIESSNMDSVPSGSGGGFIKVE